MLLAYLPTWFQSPGHGFFAALRMTGKSAGPQAPPPQSLFLGRPRRSCPRAAIQEEGIGATRQYDEGLPGGEGKAWLLRHWGGYGDGPYASTTPVTPGTSAMRLDHRQDRPLLCQATISGANPFAGVGCALLSPEAAEVGLALLKERGDGLPGLFRLMEVVVNPGSRLAA